MPLIMLLVLLGTPFVNQDWSAFAGALALVIVGSLQIIVGRSIVGQGMRLEAHDSRMQDLLLRILGSYWTSLAYGIAAGVTIFGIATRFGWTDWTTTIVLAGVLGLVRNALVAKRMQRG